MALLDFITNRNASPQQAVAQIQQAPAPATPSVANLPASVKAQAVDAGRPAAEIMGKGAEAKAVPAQPQAASAPARGRSLGMGR